MAAVQISLVLSREPWTFIGISLMSKKTGKKITRFFPPSDLGIEF